MTRYYAHHLKRLRCEAGTRFQNLMRALDTFNVDNDSTVNVDGTRIRLAVDDFKTILSEIRRLK